MNITKDTSFMASIKAFCKSIVTPGSVVNNIITKDGNMSQAQAVSEAQGFEECIQKVCEGKLSYSEMRARYG